MSNTDFSRDDIKNPVRTKSRYFGGIEGGSTNSHIVIIDGSGNIVSSASGKGTNRWQLGIDECILRLHNMVIAAKNTINLDESYQLDSLGISLSGIDSRATAEEMQASMMRAYPNDSKTVIFENDSLCPAVTAVGLNGNVIVIISGTGSICSYVEKTKILFSNGGLGYLLDHGSNGYWIALKAVKYTADYLFGYDVEFPVNHHRELAENVMNYFKISMPIHLIPLFYTKFDPSYIASFAEKVSELAKNGNLLCQKIINKCGVNLARLLCSLLNSNPQKFIDVPILCVGSVWNSWDLFSGSFIKTYRKISKLSSIRLIKLQFPPAVGAAMLGSSHQAYFDTTKTTFTLYEHH